jgi:hypothetical protein
MSAREEKKLEVEELSPVLPGGSACPLILRGLLDGVSHNYSPLKIRGVPPEAGGCYDVMDNV